MPIRCFILTAGTKIDEQSVTFHTGVTVFTDRIMQDYTIAGAAGLRTSLLQTLLRHQLFNHVVIIPLPCMPLANISHYGMNLPLFIVSKVGFFLSVFFFSPLTLICQTL